ncbi:hypothetical protein [Roseibium sp.]|uniref:hypothetical protein n=1 Tax=Roseibium sp. TaxID=1936156 RepID=UPI003A97A52F
MTSRPTLFGILRHERHPLALLAMLALVLRVTVIMVGLSVTPGVAGEGLGILCQPSVEEGQSIPRGGQHDPAHCICGPACHHVGPALGTWPVEDLPVSGLAPNAIIGTADDSQIRYSWLKTTGPIRAPPRTLT